MRYNWGPERRGKGTDRRIARDPAYAGPERRRRDRRGPQRGPSRGFLLSVAMIGMVLVDTLAWDGFYRHALVQKLISDARTTRNWSANIWHLA